MDMLTEEGSALDTLEGMVNSYVRSPRGRKQGATLSHVDGQVRRAQRAGIPEQMIQGRIRKGIKDPPYADSSRVAEIDRRYLTK